MIGSYPTPVESLVALSRRGSDLWVKRDDLSHTRYGGNKVRKLEHILVEARRRGAKRIVTIGAAGSHHVLATAVHGIAAGFEVAAVLSPQVWSAHAADNLRAGLGAGLQAFAAPSMAAVPWALANVLRRKDFFVPPGGSNAVGSVGYADAVEELKNQVAAGEMPLPDVIVAALGSGGTVAGILAGAVVGALPCRVSAIRVVQAPLVTKTSTLLLARAVARRMGSPVSFFALGRSLDVDGSFLGRGYAWPTALGANAIDVARGVGLALEPTYTAKAFAGALRLVEHRAYRTVLYWHTLSSAPMGPLLDGAPSWEDVPAVLRGLFLRDA